MYTQAVLRHLYTVAVLKHLYTLAVLKHLYTVAVLKHLYTVAVLKHLYTLAVLKHLYTLAVLKHLYTLAVLKHLFYYVLFLLVGIPTLDMWPRENSPVPHWRESAKDWECTSRALIPLSIVVLAVGLESVMHWHWFCDRLIADCSEWLLVYPSFIRPAVWAYLTKHWQLHQRFNPHQTTSTNILHYKPASGT